MFSKHIIHLLTGTLYAALITVLSGPCGPASIVHGQTMSLQPSKGNGARNAAASTGEYGGSLPFIGSQAQAWNTFFGSENNDFGGRLAVDASGNLYGVGGSYGTWGTNPVNAFLGEHDVAVVKLSSSGELLWHTFLGSRSHDYAYGMAVDGSGNVYIAGRSDAAWGAPINAFAGGADAFAVKLNSAGVKQWHTFLGSRNHDVGVDISIDESGNTYIVGHSDATWGTPLNAYIGGTDLFVACLDSNGERQWNTFLGSASADFGKGIAVDSSAQLYVVGDSNAAWGTPLNAYAGAADAFVTRLNSDGALQWNTFLGSKGQDWVHSLVLAADGTANIYIVGDSDGAWGAPVNAHAGSWDGFAARLDSSGARQWHTFLGSGSVDEAFGIAVDEDGGAYITGLSNATWGMPMNPHAGGQDAFVGKLTGGGVRQWHTFLGSAANDSGADVALGGSKNIYIVGSSYATWGTPVNNYVGGPDIFVAQVVDGRFLHLPLIMR